MTEIVKKVSLPLIQVADDAGISAWSSKLFSSKNFLKNFHFDKRDDFFKVIDS